MLWSFTIALTLEVLPLWIAAKREIEWGNRWLIDCVCDYPNGVRRGSWGRTEGGRVEAKKVWAGFGGKGEVRWRSCWVWISGTHVAGGNSVCVTEVFCRVVSQSCSLISSCIIHLEKASLWLCIFICCSSPALQSVGEWSVPGCSWLSLAGT